MKYLILSLFFFTQIQFSFSQENVSKKTIIFGSELGMSFFSGINPNSNENLRSLTIRVAPHLGFVIKNRVVLGVISDYEFVSSNFIDVPNLFGVGGYVRYYIPTGFKEGEFWNDRVLYFVDGQFLRINYYYTNNEFVTFNTLEESLARINLGGSFRFWKQFHANAAIGVEYNIGRRFRMGRRIGIEYHF